MPIESTQPELPAEGKGKGKETRARPPSPALEPSAHDEAPVALDDLPPLPTFRSDTSDDDYSEDEQPKKKKKKPAKKLAKKVRRRALSPCVLDAFADPPSLRH